EAVAAYNQSIVLKEKYLQHSRTNELDTRSLKLWRQRQTNTYAGLGRAYSSLGKHDLALASFQQGLDISEGSVSIHVQSALYRGVGDVLQRRGDFTGALANYRNALDLA